MPSPYHKNLRIAAGLLAAWGFLGRTTPAVASPQAPAEAPTAATPPASDAVTAPAALPLPKPQPTNDGPPTVLLRSNGKVLQGEILRDADGYILKNRIGVSHFKRRDVEGTFRSMEELYAYKLSLCPPEDPDERMKLATWCIEQKLKAEAKIHLEAVLELSPGNRRAKAMLSNLDPKPPASIASAGPSEHGSKDNAIERTTAVMPTTDSRLDQFRDEFARNPRAAGMPVIFDLDTPLAVRRYQEFATKVHPLLQRKCAGCHNESTPGEFQLIHIRTRKDSSNDLISRSNLESTLQIINRDDLAHSPILSAAGMTHNNGGKPALGGPSSPDYRLLAAWVTSLKPNGTKAPTLNPTPQTPDTQVEQFASGRTQPNIDATMPASRPTNRRPKIQVQGDMIIPPDSIPGVVGAMPEVDPSADQIDGSRALPAGRLIPGSEVGIPSNPPADDQFATKPLRKGKVPPPVTEPAEPGKIDPAGPKMYKMPNGESIPFMSKEDVAKKKIDPAKKPALDPKLLNNYQKARTPAKP